MNEHSSRSHALLTVQVLGVNKTTNVRTMGKLPLFKTWIFKYWLNFNVLDVLNMQYTDFVPNDL